MAANRSGKISQEKPDRILPNTHAKQWIGVSYQSARGLMDIEGITVISGAIMKKNGWTFSLVLGCVFVLQACSLPTVTTGRTSDLTAREFRLTQASKRADAGEHGAYRELVAIFDERVSDIGDLSARFDAAYIRQASIKALVLRSKRAFEMGVRADGMAWLEELESLDPTNDYLKDVRRLEAVKVLAPSLLSRLTPSAIAGRLHNRRLLGSGADGRDGALPDARSYVLLGKSEPLVFGRVLPVRAALDVLATNMGVRIQASKNISPDLMYSNGIQPIRPLQMLEHLAEQHNINFLFFHNEIVAFAGPNIPEDIDGERYIGIVKAEYVPLSSVVPVVRSIVGAENILNIDEATKSVLIGGGRGVYLRATEAVSRIDVADAEVSFDVEIYEVQSQLANEIGMRLPQLIKFGVGSSYTPGVVSLGGENVAYNAFRLSDILQRVKNQTYRMIISDPAIQLALSSSNYYIDQVSRPQIQLQDGQRARINIGQRIPVITTTASNNGFVSESISYVDSGLKVEIGARVVSAEAITAEISVESTGITGTVTSATGSSAPQLGTRMTTTRLTIGNGETAMISGLTYRQRIENRSGMPYIGATPLAAVGGTRSNQDATIELMMLVTPRIVRAREFPSRELLALSSRAVGVQSNSGMNVPSGPYQQGLQQSPAGIDPSKGSQSPGMGRRGG